MKTTQLHSALIKAASAIETDWLDAMFIHIGEELYTWSLAMGVDEDELEDIADGTHYYLNEEMMRPSFSIEDERLVMTYGAVLDADYERLLMYKDAEVYGGLFENHIKLSRTIELEKECQRMVVRYRVAFRARLPEEDQSMLMAMGNAKTEAIDSISIVCSA